MFVKVSAGGVHFRDTVSDLYVSLQRPCQIYRYTFTSITIKRDIILLYVCTGQILDRLAGFTGVYLCKQQKHASPYSTFPSLSSVYGTYSRQLLPFARLSMLLFLESSLVSFSIRIQICFLRITLRTITKHTKNTQLFFLSDCSSFSSNFY